MHDDATAHDARPQGTRPRDGGYRIRSDQTWAMARDAYLDGETAESVCDRFDLSLGAFRERAGKGGWRRCDQPDRDPLPAAADDDPGDPGDAGYSDMAAHALRELRRAMARGRAPAAASWLRIHAQLIALARAEAAADAAAAVEAAAQAAAQAATRPSSVAMAQLREQIDARRLEAEAYVARRDGAPAIAMAHSVAARAGDLARRIAATDPRDGVARAAIDQELDRLRGEILQARIPDDPDHPDAVFSDDADP